MTWKEVKEAIEKAGVKDDDKVWYIDILPSAAEPNSAIKVVEHEIGLGVHD